MTKEEILGEVESIEGDLNINLPEKYKRFLSEEVKGTDAYEIQTSNGGTVYLYNYKDVVERNENYTIQDLEQDYLLIGQDGDLGYFINVQDKSDLVYSLDLGALGSLDMDEEAKDIYKLRA